jgi:hypothetical protein
MITHCPHCGKPIYETSVERPFTEKELSRFWSHVEKKENGCWIFTVGGPVYGRLRIGGKAQLAHVASWKIHKGEIPYGHKVMHNCPDGDNPRCVNPEHLKTGTHSDNMRDMVFKKRNNPRIGIKNANSKLNSEKVLYIRESIASGIKTIKQLSSELGVKFQCVYQIARGNVWKSVGGPILNRKPNAFPLSIEQVKEIQSTVHYYGITKDLAKKFGVNQSHISRIRSGESWKKLCSKGN